MITITKKYNNKCHYNVFNLYKCSSASLTYGHNLYKCGSVNLSKPQSIQVRQSKPCIARNKQPLFYKIE